MRASATKFAFIDAVHAAELLHRSKDEVLDLIAEGRLKTYGGRPENPFLRSGDVLALANELGVSVENEPPRRTKSSTAKVQARLTGDSRWAEVSEEDVREWAARADDTRRQAARKVVGMALARLASVREVLDEFEEGKEG